MQKCPVFKLADIVGKKWTIVILQEVALNGERGFNYVFERIGKISPKILSQRLKDFEKQGLVIKEILADEMPVRTKYVITQKGRELNELITMMKKWYSKYDSKVCDCDKRECVDCPLF
ncbi:helix-turn-helix transcriptional regulator [Candidatus Woesearchaeota archaeon]|nr:helix-turn-helix transcriptional regulator [Candidatus Woesearchaeota archaeon]